ncbi:hypothetical protein [Eudoraea adriatica]|uniref:hypothetical protein n=1 Tax=Eudoraea adriatica TaxID=446681 RepID=UPI000367BC1B|nr:hypothetical protein [Eudoraea adriatica]
MKRKLKEELIKISTDIITSKSLEEKEIPQLYEAARSLYEKLAVLKFIDEKLNDIEIDVSKNVLATRFEKMANAVINENKLVPENNPHEEDIITQGIETIKGMVSEMPNSEDNDRLFVEFVAKPPGNQADNNKTSGQMSPEIKGASAPKSLNDKLSNKEITVGLNDRLAFVKHLFNDSTEDFNRVISQLNTIDSHERSIAFIENMVKPDYNQWSGKEEYESRFYALIERRFT